MRKDKKKIESFIFYGRLSINECTKAWRTNGSQPGNDFASYKDILQYQEAFLVVTTWRRVTTDI